MNVPFDRHPRLVIFDCDGVLVDSEAISVEVLLDVLAEAGCPMTAEEGYRRFLGRSIASIVRTLSEEEGLTLTDAHLQSIRARLRQRFTEDLRPIPGVAETVPRLGLPVCVASSSQPDRIRHSLELTGLWPLFAPHVFSATEVARGKPAPDLFLHAARTMEVAPAECVVVEDSPAGIRAAQAAGMAVVGFTGGSHTVPAGLKESIAALAPSAIIGDMTDLTRTIEALA